MQVMDRISFVCVFSMLSATVMAVVNSAKVPVRYHNNNLQYAESGRSEVVFEKYDSFRSMLPSRPFRHLSKRQLDGTVEENATLFDDHMYYTSQFFQPGESANELWFELSNMIGSGAFVEDLGENTTEILGDTHRVYQVWDLKFSFPFYGHILNAVGVTSGGFLYTGTIYHEQIHLTQYISPLMADFNPSLTASGRVLVYSTEERFTVQWDQVLNHDHESSGPFTFQVSIFPSGKIIFAYRELPLLWSELNNDDHPVEVGIADAVYFQFPENFVVVVEYSRVELVAGLENTSLSYAAFEIDPVPNCVTASTCESCMEITRQGNFNCSWCEAAEQKCSDGVDRYSQDWFNNGCVTEAVSTCPLPPIPSSTTTTSSSSAVRVPPSAVVSGSTSLPAASVVGIVIGVSVFLVAVIIIGVGGFFIIYGCRHPTSKIGMCLIENRPKAWKLNKGANQSSKYEMHTKFENVYE